MPTKTFDALDSVPEAQRATAIETKAGKFVVFEEDEALRETGRAALQRERDARQAEKTRADEAAAELERLRIAAKAAEGKVSDSALAELRAEFEKKAQTEKDRADAAEQRLRDREKERLIDSLLLANGAMSDRIAKARRDVEDRLALNDAGDALVVTDGKGKVTAETPADFVKAHKKEASYYYAGTGAGGGGSSGSEGGGGDPSAADRARLVDAKRQQVAGAF